VAIHGVVQSGEAMVERVCPGGRREGKIIQRLMDGRIRVGLESL
jgi:hypothetical protein